MVKVKWMPNAVTKCPIFEKMKKKNKIKREGIRKKKGSQTTYSLACVKKRKQSSNWFQNCLENSEPIEPDKQTFSISTLDPKRSKRHKSQRMKRHMCTHFKEKKEKELSCVYRFWSHAGPKLRGRLPTKRRERKRGESSQTFQGNMNIFFYLLWSSSFFPFFFFCEE